MYTAEEVEYLTETYKAAEDKQAAVDELAEKLNKSRRSIIGKLSRLEIYEKKIYLTKRGETPVTKKEIVHNISEKMGIEVEKLEGLDKAPKEVLKLIEAHL